MTRRRVGIMISGRGSNMSALIAAAARPDYPAEVALVISNKPQAPGLRLASDAGIATQVIDYRGTGSREAFEAEATAAFDGNGIELVCLAGFMRLLTPSFVRHWRNRMINIHPSLLPAFPGLNTHERVLAAGVRVTGCTVHFVRVEMDTGPIIAQAGVAVAGNDTTDTLAARVLEAEHRLYPHALGLVASGRTRIVGERVVVGDEPAPPPPLFVPADA